MVCLSTLASGVGALATATIASAAAPRYVLYFDQ